MDGYTRRFALDKIPLNTSVYWHMYLNLLIWSKRKSSNIYDLLKGM